MLVALAPLLLVVLTAACSRRRGEEDARTALVDALIAAAAFVAVSTEILSQLGMLSTFGVAAAWALATVAAIFLSRPFSGLAESVRRLASASFRPVAEAPLPLTLIVAAVLSVTLALALTSPPNTYDSMTYHLARVAHWAQAGNVEFYPTSILRQLYQPPFAEYAILHLELLSGGDRYANFVQWTAFVGCGAVASLIVRELGGGRAAQASSAALALTIPAAIVQASGTQNDLAEAFFVGAFFLYWLRAARSDSRFEFVLAGVSLGLAILCKGTAYPFCFAIGAYFAVVRFLEIPKEKRVRFVGSVALVLALGAAFNVPHYARNARLFGAPVAVGGDKVSNDRLTPAIVAANLTRNLALHFGTGVKSLDSWTESWIKALLGDQAKNPESTWLDNEFAITYSNHEDNAGNPFHFLLIVVSLGAAPFVLRGRGHALGLVFAIVFSFVLLSLLFKWQMWGSRLQMPIFVLGASLASMVIERVAARLAVPVAIAAFVFSFGALIHGVPRSVLDAKGAFVMLEPRRKQMFRNLPDLEPYYADACAFVNSKRPDEVGMFLDYNDYEYPLWTMLKTGPSEGPRIRHVGVTNVSSRLSPNLPPPEYVITMRTERKIEGYDYEEVWARNPVWVLRRK